jgi:glycosyltransferase involved in cell wall biosynthesis
VTSQSFNNFLLRDNFRKQDCSMKFLVSSKKSFSKDSFTQFPRHIQQALEIIGRKINRTTGYQNRSQFWTRELLYRKSFLNFDVHHYHLIENGWFGIDTLFKAEKKVPTLWTWHDLWPVTGHCIQPQACNRWLKGCGNCPDLNRAFSVKIDKTRQQVSWKESKYKNTKFLIHTSTTWMENKIRLRMPFLEDRIRVIPFGIKPPELITPKFDLRTKYGYSDTDKILLIRGTSGAYKNMSTILEVFKRFPKIAGEFHLIDFDSSGLFRNIKFASLREYNWIDKEIVFELLKISDLFVLPSSAETFGVLGVEAQLSGIPVLYQLGTACEEVLGGTETAIAFNGFNAINEIASYLEKLLDQPDYFIKIGDQGRTYAQEKFSPDIYINKMINTYSFLQESF